MSFKDLERDIRNECRTICQNPRLKDADIVEWSTSEKKVKDSLDAEKEVYIHVDFLGVHCAVLQTADKRKHEKNFDDFCKQNPKSTYLENVANYDVS